MRSAIYGVIFTVFLASAGTVQAANGLDGKSLLCTSKSQINPVFGLIFDQGKVSRHEVDGYSKVIEYTKPYDLDGTNTVHWWFTNIHRASHDRETLRVTVSGPLENPSWGYPHLCSISSKTRFSQNLIKLSQRQKRRIRFRSQPPRR
jgi:hypothetical protein